ncbi:hypothetical protein [Mycobacterium dioxanotrophicus]|jgi:hypothetical protein|nr:hypothetical protein [Mycobacterium dioxanotrophicus]
MQSFGIVLQLVGSLVTLGGLFYAWHKASGLLVRLRESALQLWDQFVESVVDRLTPPAPPVDPGTSAGTLPKMTSQAYGHVDGGTDGERLARLESENAMRAQEIREVHAAIDKARAAALDELEASSAAVRLADIYPALIGIVISIAGMVCQLVG